MRLLVVSLLAAVGGATTQSTDSRLPVVPGAIEVEWTGPGGSSSVTFEVRDPLPARATVAFLLDSMTKRGWTLQQLGLLRPQWWEGYRSGLAGTHDSHVWEAWWHDASGGAVRYQLTYKCPLEDQGMHSTWVRVSGRHYSQPDATRLETERRQWYEKLCALLRASDVADERCAE